MGVEVTVEGLSKSFGKQTIWSDVTLTLPQGEISVLLGPSGTGKSVFLKSLVGLLKPERGRVVINGVDVCSCSEHKLYEVRKLFGVLFQDGALFGSMNLYDNIAFPLREHTRKPEPQIRQIVLEKMEMVGLIGAETKLPGELSGGMRKRAGLARALVLDPEIILFDEPDSGLDPVRTAYLNQLIVDLNAQIDATCLVVTHDINTARALPDNIGMLFRRNLVMYGPREMLLTSSEPVVEQFLNGRRHGPIGMSEEKDSGQAAAELAEMVGNDEGLPHIIPQLEVSSGVPERKAVRRRKDRVMRDLHTLPEAAQQEIISSLTSTERERYGMWLSDHSSGLSQPTTEETGPVAAVSAPQPSPASPPSPPWQAQDRRVPSSTPRSREPSLSGSLSEDEVAHVPRPTPRPRHAQDPNPRSSSDGLNQPDRPRDQQSSQPAQTRTRRRRGLFRRFRGGGRDV